MNEEIKMYPYTWRKIVVHFFPQKSHKGFFFCNISIINHFFSGLGESGSFIGDRIQLNLNASQVEMGSQPADALIYINFTTGARFAFLLNAINTSCKSMPH